ncbi:MAG TPA: histidine phosphatase family protein [Chitinophagaceae bacterium]|jgi:phosphohistidine phosphatase|nr:histidine phosphatase family protein [Chitinophagaceae bacterium]
MKTLILVRHAKSSWDTTGIDDFDRPLNERGKKDAPEMAKRLRKRRISIDLFLSSPAKRALKTAECFADEFKLAKTKVSFVDQLYHASVATFVKVVDEISDRFSCAIMFSHNPGITDYANSLTNVHIDNIPTCGIFAVQADVNSWSAFNKSEKFFLFFDYPKNPLAML